MKKVLFASTALVAFASAASAEITMKGWAEMGVVGGDRFTVNPAGTTSVSAKTQFWNDIDIEFTLSGESDSGLSFGARVDLDEGGNLGNTARNQGTSMFVSGSFGTLTLGDTDGAIDWAITDAGNIGNPGSISDDETTHAGYWGVGGDAFFDNQVLRYDYSFGDFAFAISYEQGAYGGGNALATVFPVPAGFASQLGNVPDVPGAPGGTIQVGAKYKLDLGGATVNLGAGLGNLDLGAVDIDIMALSASGAFGGGFQAGVEFTRFDAGAGGDIDHVGIGLGYESGPIALHANWGEFDFGGGFNVSGWGLTGAYDLGGGLKVKAGVGNSDFGGVVPDATVWSLGFTMAF